LGAVARAIPIDRLLIETDGPFIFPRTAPRHVFQAAGGRCEPCHIVYVLEQLATLRGIKVGSTEYKEMAAQIHANSCRAFGIVYKEAKEEQETAICVDQYQFPVLSRELFKK